MSETINAAIVGLGRWGELLVSSVDESDIIRCTAAVTRTPSKVEEFCAERGIKLSDQLEDVLGDESINALSFVTPLLLKYMPIIHFFLGFPLFLLESSRKYETCSDMSDVF